LPASFFDPLLRLLLTPVGIGVLAALDSTVVFFLPLGVDLAMVVMAGRHPQWFWLYPIVGTAGSVVGAATSFAIGHAAGEAGLKHWIPPKRIEKIQARARRSGAPTLAALDLMPPPFPFTLFVVAAGALNVDRWRFFGVLALVRLFRFGVEAALGARYGTGLAMQIGHRLIRDVAGLYVLAAIAVSVVSLVRVLRRRAG
jgi:membrane protein YqaA with SNARE-associated domain